MTDTLLQQLIRADMLRHDLNRQVSEKYGIRICAIFRSGQTFEVLLSSMSNVYSLYKQLPKRGHTYTPVREETIDQFVTTKFMYDDVKYYTVVKMPQKCDNNIKKENKQ